MKILKKIGVILVLSCFCLALTGCTDDAPKEDIMPPKTNATKDELDITFSARTVANTVVFYVKNKSDVVAHDVTVEVEFWKKAPETKEDNGEIDDGFTMEGEKAEKPLAPGEDIYVSSTKINFEFIKNGQTVVGNASVGKKEYDYYKIFIDVNDAGNAGRKFDFAYDDLIIEDETILNPTDEQIAEGIKSSDYVNIVVKNKGEKRINMIEIGVVYYKDNKIVGYGYKQKLNLDSKIKTILKISFPKGMQLSQDVEFDTYRVFINKVYRSKGV